MMEINGSLAEILLTFNEKNEIDEDKLSKYLDFLAKNGVTAVFTGGLAAETDAISEEERNRWLELVIKYRQNLSVIFQIKNGNNEEIRKQLDYAEKLGVDVISVSQPYPIPLSSKEIKDYISYVCGKSKLPVMIYNEPSIGKQIDINIVNELAKENKNILYYKDSTHNLIDLHTLIMQNSQLRVLAGSDGLIFDIMNAGGSGVVSLVVNPFPEIIADEINALKKKDIEKALELQYKIIKIRGILKEGGFTAGYRYAMKLRGIDIGEPPFPYSKLDNITESHIKEELEKIGLI